MYMLLAVVVLAAVTRLIVIVKRLPLAVVQAVQHFVDIQCRIMA
jgi:hypothetical protein